MMKISEQVVLPCGAVLPNRIAKAAMTEGLAGPDNQGNARFVELDRRWGAGGAGLLVTGNFLVDRWHLERGGNLAIEGEQTDRALSALADIATAAKSQGSLIVVQLNHAGRQTQKAINKTPKAPSAVGLKMGNGRFAPPTPPALAGRQRLVAASSRAPATNLAIAQRCAPLCHGAEN